MLKSGAELHAERKATTDTSIKASCHCGGVIVTVPRKPKSINECQCTLCRRYAAAWAYYNTKEVDIITLNIKKYRWGDKQIDFCFCGDCGCMCYWYPVDMPEEPEGGYKMGVNTRIMDPNKIAMVNREIDFDTLREPLKSKETAHHEDQAKYCS